MQLSIQEMCHVHTTDNMLQNKITAIIDCYFQSSTPPKLQLNIPMNVADEVISKRQGPYIFRVAQVMLHMTCTYSTVHVQCVYPSYYGGRIVASSLGLFQVSVFFVV